MLFKKSEIFNKMCTVKMWEISLIMIKVKNLNVLTDENSYVHTNSVRLRKQHYFCKFVELKIILN